MVVNKINLPTYEQVEQVKQTVLNVDATSGQVLDVNNKKYKAVMHNRDIFMNSDGVDYSEILNDIMSTRYPTFNLLKNVGFARKTYLFGNYYLITNGNEYAIFDISTWDIVYAEMVPSELIIMMSDHRFFMDDNYIYIRGYHPTQYKLAFVVIDKRTFEFIGPMHTTNNSYNPFSYSVNCTDIVLIGEWFFMSVVNIVDAIFTFHINYNSSGIPISFTPNTTANYAIGAGSGYNVHALFEYDGYLYEISPNTTSDHRVFKMSINHSTGKTSLVAESRPNNMVASMSVWNTKYTANGKPFFIAAYGNGPNGRIIVYDIETMDTKLTITNNDKNHVVFDYINGDCFYVQQSSMSIVHINGNAYEYILKYVLNGENWSMERFRVPISLGNDGAQSRSNYFMELYGVIKDGDVYFRSVNPNLNMTKLKKIDLISHYEEVTE